MTCRPPALHPSSSLAPDSLAWPRHATSTHAVYTSASSTPARVSADAFTPFATVSSTASTVRRAAIELAQSLGLRLTRVLRKGFGSHLVGPGGRVRHHVSQTTDWKKLANAFSGALDVYRLTKGEQRAYEQGEWLAPPPEEG